MLLDAKRPTAGIDVAATYYQLIGDVTKTNRLPSAFVQLLRKLCCQHTIESTEILIALVYYLFLEMGFGPQTLSSAIKANIRTHWGYSFVAQIPEYSVDLVAEQINQRSQRNEQTNQMPSTSKMDIKQHPDQHHHFNLNLINLSDHELQLIVRKLSNGIVCITFCLDQGLETKSIVLTVSEYILFNSDNCNIEHIQQNPGKYFTNVQHLSSLVKEELIIPIRNILMDRNSFPNGALNGLPKETLWSLFKLLKNDLNTLQRISQSCVYLRYMVTEFMDEFNIRIRARRPTRIVHDNDHRLNRYRRFHLQMAFPDGLFYSRRSFH